MPNHNAADATDSTESTNDSGNESTGTQTPPLLREKTNNPDELPDGSGTSRADSASDHGQEEGDDSFDAG